MPTLPTRTTRTTAPPTPAAAPSRPARPSPARTPAPSPVARRAAPPAVRLPTPAPAQGGAVHVHTEGAAAEHAIRPTGLAEFAGTAGPGEPLPQAVRPQLEETLGVSLEHVRVHTDTRAAAVASSLNARAFTYGTHIFLGPRERPTDLRLIAHEAAHVVQQQGAAPTPQPLTESGGDAYEREAERASAAAVSGEQFTVQERTPSPRVQRLGLSDILDGLAELAANVPGFTLLTVIIGRNPINMRAVERNFTNLLRGFMGLIPGGELLFQILNRYGVVERIGRWVSDEVASLGLTYEYLRRRFNEFTDSLGWRDIFSPGDVWRRAENIFTEPVNRISAFVSRLISQAVTWLKETFMQPLSDFARRIPGYTLVTVLLGRDPFTNAPVDRSPLNLVRAFAEFIPGGTEKVNQLVESRALQRAHDWFVQETRARNLTWDRVTGTFAEAWNSLRLEDVLHPIDTVARVANVFRPLMGDLVGFAQSALMKLLELIFEAAMGAGGARVLAILKRAQSTFSLIIRDPVGFLRNLLGAVGQGVRQFMTNILRHLQQGVIAWLTGPVARAGIQMPERWDLRGIIWFVMQILGLTWDRVRQKLVRVLGERVVATLEGGFQLIQEIRQRGLVEALRERVTEFFGQLQEAALGGIRSFVQRQLVRAGIMQLLSLLNPVGAVIQAIVKTYTTVRFFMDRMRQILDLVESVLDSIASIAAGSVGAAANLVERTMARTIPVILDFLARFINLGDVGGHVQRTIQSLQQRVDAMLDRAVEWIRTQASRLRTLAAGAVRSGARDHDRPVPFAGAGHTIRGRITPTGVEFLMASGDFAPIKDQLLLISNRYLDEHSGLLSRPAHAAAAAELRRRIGDMDPPSGMLGIIRTARRDILAARSNPDLQETILNQTEDSLQTGIRQLGEYMAATFPTSFGPGGNVPVGAAVLWKVPNPNRAVTVTARGVIVGARDFRNSPTGRAGEFGIEADDNGTRITLSYHAYGQQWELAPAKQPFQLFTGTGPGTHARWVILPYAPVAGGDDPDSSISFSHLSPAQAALYVRKGHLIAKMFKGTGDWSNIVPMTYNANQSRMLSVETTIRNSLPPAPTATSHVIRYTVTPNYSSSGAASARLPPVSVSLRVERLWPLPPGSAPVVIPPTPSSPIDNMT